jgi:hypothetical protein
MVCLTLVQTASNDGTLPSKFTLLLDSGGHGVEYQPRFIAASLGADLFIAIRGPFDISEFSAFLEFKITPFLKRSISHRDALKFDEWVLNQSAALISNCMGSRSSHFRRFRVIF